MPPSPAEKSSRADLFDDYPTLKPGRITYANLRAIVEWRDRHGINDEVSLATVEAYREEGYSAAQAGVQMGLIDYGQATGDPDY